MSGRGPGPIFDERILVFVGGARDGALTRDLLAGDGLSAVVCASFSDLEARIAEGGACVVLTEELLTVATTKALSAILSKQPPWSDLPVIVFSAAAKPDQGSFADALRSLGNVIVLVRPIHVQSMLASVHVAMRSRRRQYEARRELEARDMFLAMLAHELRNPLAVIRLAVATLGQSWPGQALPKELTVAERSSTHLALIVDDLLDVARVTQGKLVLRREPTNLIESVRGAFDGIEPRARERGLRWSFRAAAERVWIDADPARLEQVFANLLSNAVKYTPPGGAVEVSIDLDGGDAIVEIEDTGVGLSPDMIERVFDVFAQADVSLDRSQGGIGIGLALVRSLVQLHGGDVVARSEGAGRGATFRVRLPRTERPFSAPGTTTASESTKRMEGRADARSKRVVVVDDNDDLRDLLQALIERKGHDVATAADGPRGLERILETSPHVAFVDLGLPGFDGLELARRVRSAGRALWLVAISGYGRAEDKQRAIEAGFDEHLTKPIGIDQIGIALERGLRAGGRSPSALSG